MISLQRHAQNAVNTKDIRLKQSISQKLRTQQQISTSIILTGNTNNESKTTIDSTKLVSKKKFLYSDIIYQNNKSIRADSGAVIPLTTPKAIKNNCSNQFSCDILAIFGSSTGKISNNQNLNKKSSFNSRQTSSVISKASYLNLSKGNLNNISDCQVISVKKEDAQIYKIKCDFNKYQKQINQSLEKKSNEQFENKNKNKISNYSNKLISQRDKNMRKLGSILYQNDTFIQKQNKSQIINSDFKDLRILKNPLSYQNLIKSLAKQTQIEQQLLEETTYLEKQIQDSQEQIKNLLSVSTNRELSKEQSGKEYQNQSAKQQEINQQIFSISNEALRNSSQKLDDKDLSYNTPKKETNKQQLNVQLKQDKKSQDSLLASCNPSKISSTQNYFFNGNISQRSKKIRFQENITKLHQFQEQLENKDLKIKLQKQSNQNQQKNQDSQKSIQQPSCIDIPLIEMVNFSPNKLISSPEQLLIEDNKQNKIQIEEEQQQLQEHLSAIDQNSLTCNSNKHCVKRNQASSYLISDIKAIPINKQDINSNQSFIQKLSTETFSLHQKSYDNLESRQIINLDDKLEQNQLDKSSFQIQIHKQNNNEVLQSKENSEQYKLFTPQIQKNKQNQINQSNELNQDIKSNKKLEILNLLSRINCKCQTPSSSKQNKSCNAFEKTNLNIKSHNNLNNSQKKKSYRLFFESDNERIQSPINNKNTEIISQKDDDINNKHIQEIENSTANVNIENQSQQSGKLNLKNTQQENLKILLSNQDSRKMMNTFKNQINNTNRVANLNLQNVSIKNLLKHIFNKSSKQHNM